MMSQDGRTLLNLKRVRQIDIVETSIMVWTDYGTEVKMAEYNSDTTAEKAMLDLTKDIYQGHMLVFLMPEEGWNGALY